MNSNLLDTIKSLISAADAEVNACDKIMADAKAKKDAALAKIESYRVTYADVAKVQHETSDSLHNAADVLPELVFRSFDGSVKAAVIDAFAEGEKLTVTEVFDRVAAKGSQSNKPTVNAALHRLAKSGILENVGLGVYKKPKNGESRL